MVGTGLRFASTAPSIRLVASASRTWKSGLASASLRLLPPSGSSLALPVPDGRDWPPLRFDCSLHPARRWRFPRRLALAVRHLRTSHTVGTGIRCASAWWSGLASASLRRLPPSGSSLALPVPDGRDWPPLRFGCSLRLALAERRVRPSHVVGTGLRFASGARLVDLMILRLP